MSGEFGYVRASCTDQNEERQMIALRENGIQNRNIYMDKMSGKDFNRKTGLKTTAGNHPHKKNTLPDSFRLTGDIHPIHRPHLRRGCDGSDRY